MKFAHLLSTAVVLTCSSTLYAADTATMTSSTTIPTPGTNDIYQLSSSNGAGTNNATTAFWNNQPGQGQSFTSGGNFGGYDLNSVTLQGYILNYGAPGPYLLTFGTYNSTTNSFLPLTTYTAATDAVYNSTEYMTFTLNTPYVLSANTVYGFEIGVSGGNTSNTDGGVLAISTGSGAASAYKGGTAFSTQPTGGAKVTSTSANNFDLVFDLGITATPEPSTYAMMLGGLGVLFFGLHRRSKSRRS